MSLLDDIPEGDLVGLDTACWIYAVESHPTFEPVVQSFILGRLKTGKNLAGSSLLALAELLVLPLKLGRRDLVDTYRAYFQPGPNWSVWEVTRVVIEKAAELRAKYALKLADAIHVASAILQQASVFLCNDNGLRRVKEIKVLIVADYVTAGTP